ncbi:MAG: DUF1329 domain-containing protein [Desulfobacterales bacterium]|jgi:hypothetical protein|nr:DUF1329 domain-containing protein [Desulfobacterales bacterium]
MDKKILFIFGILISFWLITAPVVMAKVTAEEAAALGTTLTPFGAERAGNAAGTIPAWDGGITAPPAGLGYQGPGSRYPDPYQDDKKLFSINAGNMEQYGDQLSDGVKELLRKYPDTYRLDVYPTHRSHAAPEWVYDHTKENATRAELIDDDNHVTGAYGGVPFPIPKTGGEIVWNHTLRWLGDAQSLTYNCFLVQPDGNIVLSSGSTINTQYPYYYKEGGLESFKGDYFLYLSLYIQPARRKGEIVLVIDSVDLAHNPRRSYQYLTGQRRVRRAPTVAYDTPNPAFSGTVTYDDAFMFNGTLERYDWKIIRKQEMFIPYNCYKALEKTAPSAKYQKGHMNPEYLRWELHRVWVVEATLKSGERHSYGRRIFIHDEDSYILILTDSFDGRDKLWRTNMAVTANAYDLPGVNSFTNIHYDLPSGIYATNFDPTEAEKLTIFNQRLPEDYFTPDQIRRMGQ